MSLILKLLGGVATVAVLAVMCLFDAAFGLINTMAIPALICLLVFFLIDMRAKNKVEPKLKHPK